ncbi:hypothetical protein SASPL_140062 [Salvia splendens]|uniref:DYW domain-containing protein n=1 Tax=Salvia splendens TaxID=180675 RepID=A0A8X8WN69_SALSN|nr:hypothetical protein SASPL_140062 [Salvia splendens]
MDSSSLSTVRRQAALNAAAVRGRYSSHLVRHISKYCLDQTLETSASLSISSLLSLKSLTEKCHRCRSAPPSFLLRATVTTAAIDEIKKSEWSSLVHEFLVSDRMLDEVEEAVRGAGHVTDTSEVYYDVDREWKEGMMCQHSERLAIAFGLISTKPARDDAEDCEEFESLWELSLSRCDQDHIQAL